MFGRIESSGDASQPLLSTEVPRYRLRMVTQSGVFWLANRPEKKVAGHLYVDDDGRPSLEVHGKLVVGNELHSHNDDTGEMSRAALEPTDLLILGLMIDMPRRVTLTGCMAVGGHGVLGIGMELEEQKIHVGVLIRGAHVAGSAQVYSAARVRVADTDVWANFPPIQRAAGEAAISAPDLDLPTAETASGVLLSIDENTGGTFGSLTEGRLTRSISVQVDSFGDLRLRQIDREYATPITSYLRLALGTNSPLTGIEVNHEGTWLQVQHPGVRRNVDSTRKSHQVFLPLATAGLEVIGEFLEVYKKTGPVAPVLADLLPGGSSLNLETQVLELTTIAEGVHRNLYIEDERMPTEDAERIKRSVAKAVEGEIDRYRQIVNGSLSYLQEANYKTRVKRLASEVAQAMPGVCGNESRWVKVVSDARNSFAHRKENFLPEQTTDEYYAVSQSLRWVLTGNLLLKSGVPAETLSIATRSSALYQQFLRNMKGALPSVYGRDADT